MDWSTSSFPVHHKLLEFTQTHVHQVGDAIQPDARGGFFLSFFLKNLHLLIILSNMMDFSCVFFFFFNLQICTRLTPWFSCFGSDFSEQFSWPFNLYQGLLGISNHSHLLFIFFIVLIKLDIILFIHLLVYYLPLLERKHHEKIHLTCLVYHWFSAFWRLFDIW